MKSKDSSSKHNEDVNPSNSKHRVSATFSNFMLQKSKQDGKSSNKNTKKPGRKKELRRENKKSNNAAAVLVMNNPFFWQLYIIRCMYPQLMIGVSS